MTSPLPAAASAAPGEGGLGGEVRAVGGGVGSRWSKLRRDFAAGIESPRTEHPVHLERTEPLRDERRLADAAALLEQPGRDVQAARVAPAVAG